MSSEKYLELKRTSESYPPSELADCSGFTHALHIARDMLVNDEGDETLREYATSLFEVLRAKYPDQWNADWRYDALLSFAYEIILKYDEKYEACKRAFDKAQPPPPELLYAMAGCCIAPGYPPVTGEEAIALLKQAVTSAPYVEVVEFLRGLYRSMGNDQERQYWENILMAVKDVGPHLTPPFQIDDL